MHEEQTIIDSTGAATLAFLEQFSVLHDRLNSPSCPELENQAPAGTNQASLLQNRQYPLAMRLSQTMEASTQEFFDGLARLSAEGVDPNAVRLIALWRYHAHLVLTSIRCYSAVVLAQSTYHQNYSMGPGFLLSLIGLGGSYQAAETSQRAICDKAHAEWVDADNAVATNMRGLQMEAEQLGAALQQRYPNL